MDNVVVKKQESACLQALVERSQKQPKSDVKSSLFQPHNLGGQKTLIFSHENYSRWGANIS